MSAPLPLRFYNPVKELCSKVNLDYETVIGTGITNKTIRDAYIISEVKKLPTEIQSQDKKLIKHKKEFFDRKYGDGNSISTGTTETSETTDKGYQRYNLGANVEYIQPDDSTVDKSAGVSNGVEVAQFAEFGADRIKYHKAGKPWVPGRPYE